MPAAFWFLRRLGFVALVAVSVSAGLSYALPTPDAVLPDGARYYGPLLDGQFVGQGRLEWPNGARYEGSFDEGMFSGHGRMLLADGSVYQGEFRRGMMAGQGRMQLPDGSVYTGGFRDNNFNGQGRHELPDDAVYEGEFLNGYYHGQGRMVSVAATHIGEYRYGHYWGQGELNYATGDNYRGEFVRGQFQGKGRFQRANGEIFEGDFTQGDLTGQGSYADTTGARYLGGFRAWQFHGAGHYTDAAGNVYEGEFDDGTLNGAGRYSGKDGTRYQGEFLQWLYHGQGTLRLANGDVYEGGFRYGNYHGEGTLTYAEPADGKPQLISGVWKHGRLDDPERQLRTRRNVEAALYRQPALLERALTELAPSSEPSRMQLYLLAVGGDGGQEVFRREVEFIKEQFDRDYGTHGRSLVLVNSRNTVESLPMATATSIGDALKTIGSRMNKEEDILFLYLTSHGSRRHEFVLAQNGMELPDLPAEELAELLRESGIRWKVVVVSACYSGGFIDPVADDYTLVITAARHDRQSFGCADENDFTYFGRAFFKEALPAANSFEDAFRTAEALIEQWEQDKGEQSLPQIRGTPAIRQQLERWWQQAHERAPVASTASVRP